MKNLSELEQAYLALALDTEGWVGFTGQGKKTIKPKVTVEIYNASRELVERLHQMAGVGRLYTKKADRWRKKPLYRLQIAKRNDVEQLLSQIVEWSIVKKELITFILEYLKERKKRKRYDPLTSKELEILRECGFPSSTPIP